MSMWNMVDPATGQFTGPAVKAEQPVSSHEADATYDYPASITTPPASAPGPTIPNAYYTGGSPAGATMNSLLQQAQSLLQQQAPNLMSKEEAARQLSAGAGPGSAAWNTYYGTGGYYSQAPSVQAASPAPPAATASPSLPSPTYTNTPGYNPYQYATMDTAKQVAALTGGQVYTQKYPTGPFNLPDMNYISGLGPDMMNAGLLADALSKYSPEYVARTYGIPVGSLPAGGAFASQLAAAGQPSPTPDYLQQRAQTTTPYQAPNTTQVPYQQPRFQAPTNFSQPQNWNPVGQYGNYNNVGWPYMNLNGFVPQAQYMQNTFQQAFPGYNLGGWNPFGAYGNFGNQRVNYAGLNSANFGNVFGTGYNFYPGLFGMNNQGSQAGTGVGANVNLFNQPQSATMRNFATVNNYANPSFMGGSQGNQYNPYGRMNYGGYSGQGYNYR